MPARGVGRSVKESQDVGRAQENVAALQAQLQELEADLQADIAAVEAAHGSSADTLEHARAAERRDDQPETETRRRAGEAGGADLGGAMTSGVEPSAR